MESPKYQGIAVLSGILTIMAFSHLVYKVYLTKQTEHFTYQWIFLVITAQCLLILYGILHNSYGIYLPAGIIMLGVIYIFYIKINYTLTTSIENELKIKNII